MDIETIGKRVVEAIRSMPTRPGGFVEWDEIAKAIVPALKANGLAVVNREELDRLDMALGNYINEIMEFYPGRCDSDFIRLRTDYEEAHANGLFTPPHPHRQERSHDRPSQAG